MKSVRTQYGIVQYPETIQDRTVVANLWEKNGKSRVYFKVLFPGSTPVDCGYIDGQTGHKGAIQSRPVSWGQYLAPQVSFQATTEKNDEVYNTGFGYYGTAADAARGFDGIE